MAHNIDMSNGVGRVFATKPMWHMLGTVVETAQTSEEAIKLAGLDYNVEKQKIYINGNREVNDYYATVRTDLNLPLGIVGNKYTVLQNVNAFKFVDDIVGKKEAIFETAGALKNGERIWLTCKLPNKMVIGNDDVADLYFMLTNNHNGKSSIEMLFTPTFVVCNNTFRMAMNNGKRKQKVKHTANLLDKMNNAVDLMGITRFNIQQIEEAAKAMVNVNLNDKQIRKLIEMAMQPQIEQISEEDFSTRFINLVDDVFEYATTDSSQLIVERKGTLWGAVQGINGYYNNVKSYKTREDKFNSLIYNTGALNSTRAWDLGLQVLTNEVVLN